MPLLQVIQTQKAPSAQKIVKQMTFGLARGLTRLGSEAVEAVQGAVRGEFIIRNQVFTKGPKRIQRTVAKPTNLQTVIGTEADFLAIHDTGGTKKPRGKHLAVPTANIRPNIKQIIPTSKRPRVLLAGKGTTVSAIRRGKARDFKGKGAFIMRTKHGQEVIAQRIGRGKKGSLRFLYNLENTVRIPRRPVFREPIEKVNRRRGQMIINKSIEEALRNIKP